LEALLEIMMPTYRERRRQPPIKCNVGQQGQSTPDAGNESASRLDDITLHAETGTSTVQHVVTKTLTEEQEIATYEAIRLLYPYAPRDSQVEALHHLIYRHEDLILIARTSFGKSMILQAVSALFDRMISIVILPLDQGQAETMARIGRRPCFLTSNTISTYPEP
jgi:hypothetical protein